jgi:hypothetical protein
MNTSSLLSFHCICSRNCQTFSHTNVAHPSITSKQSDPRLLLHRYERAENGALSSMERVINEYIPTPGSGPPGMPGGCGGGHVFLRTLNYYPDRSGWYIS